MILGMLSYPEPGDFPFLTDKTGYARNIPGERHGCGIRTIQEWFEYRTGMVSGTTWVWYG